MRTGPLRGPYQAMGRACAAHRHRDDVPLEVHHVWPLGDGGPNTADNRVVVCSNAHSSTHHLLDRYHRAGSMDAVPWSVRRRYGRGVRELARRGWEQIRAHERGTADAEDA